MKKIAFTAFLAFVSMPAAAADYSAAPEMAPAADKCSGHVEAYIGGSTFDFDSTETFWAYGGAGRVNCNFHERWNAQGDLMLNGVSNDGDSLNAYGGALHVYMRDPSSYAFGAFASLEGYGGTDSLEDVYRYMFGFEGQIYSNNVTYYGQVFYGQFDGISSANVDLWGGRGVVRYYLHDNLKLEGELGYRHLTGSGNTVNVFTAAAEVAYRFDSSPLSVFGRYQFENIDPSTSSNLSGHKYVVGLRASFGSNTLLEEDRYGATMDTIEPLYIY